jgi:hypothetical protein
MECKICKELERRFQIELSEYDEARASAYYQVSKKFAAHKNVDMERARFEFEEHCRSCVFIRGAIPLPPVLNAASALKRLAA